MGRRGKDEVERQRYQNVPVSIGRAGDGTSSAMNNVNKDSTKVTTTKKSGPKLNRMSHSVTVTRTTTTTTTSAIILNTGYLKTFPGILKLLEVVVAAVCLTLACLYVNIYFQNSDTVLYFFSVIVTALIASGCLLISCLISLSTGSIISKTIYELVYHFVMFVLVLIASILLLIRLDRYRHSYHTQQLTAAILGLILSVLYFISTFLAFKTYRSL